MLPRARTHSDLRAPGLQPSGMLLVFAAGPRAGMLPQRASGEDFRRCGTECYEAEATQALEQRVEELSARVLCSFQGGERLRPGSLRALDIVRTEAC